MKWFVCILFASVCVSLSGQARDGVVNGRPDPVRMSIESRGDTICMKIAPYDLVSVYTKDELEKIAERNPELLRSWPMDPYVIADSKERGWEYDCEACEDEFFLIYAYFLRRQNGDEKYAEVRGKLTDIYSAINDLYGQMRMGGTYFGHQMPRIIGYAEYSVWVYMFYEGQVADWPYDITDQKKLYIASLRQLVKDESMRDPATPAEKRSGNIKELNRTVDRLDELITDIFYLRRAQEFQHRHYEYYY